MVRGRGVGEFVEYVGTGVGMQENVQVGRESWVEGLE